MEITQDTLDDVMHDIFSDLLQLTDRVNPTRGANRERVGVLLRLSNPRARISRSEGRGRVFSPLGELLWYLARSSDLRFINYYLSAYNDESEDGRTVYGAYGPRLVSMGGSDQIKNVLKLLRSNSASRRAVIHLFEAADIDEYHKAIPCTCLFQFLVRRGRLHMLTTMRSNDAYLGVPHDVFAFTMLQEVIARSLGIEVGEYVHFVGSLHLYDRDAQRAQRYVDEGFQPTSAPMPAMPDGDPWLSIDKVLFAERQIRAGREVDIEDLSVDPYWADLVRLLQIYGHERRKEPGAIVALKLAMASQVYDPYIDEREERARK